MADFVPSPDAKRVLTVGPTNGQTKAMQAAGRLRLPSHEDSTTDHGFGDTRNISAKTNKVPGANNPLNSDQFRGIYCGQHS